MRKYLLILSFTILIIPAATLAFGGSIRYKGKLIHCGDTKTKVLDPLGEPRDKNELEGKYYPGKTVKRDYVSGKLEEWIYTKINTTYSHIITFKGSKVIMIEKERK